MSKESDLKFLNEMIQRLDDADTEMVRTMIQDWITEIEYAPTQMSFQVQELRPAVLAFALQMEAPPPADVAEFEHDHFRDTGKFLFGSAEEELNKLLSQEREKAVPEGIVSAESSYRYLGDGVYQPVLELRFASGSDSMQLWILRDKAKALLTPSPASLNEKEGGE